MNVARISGLVYSRIPRHREPDHDKLDADGNPGRKRPQDTDPEAPKTRSR